MALEKIWDDMRDRLQQSLRWAYVRGPLSSAIVTLWDFGFETRSPTKWLDPDGCLWTLDPMDPNFASAAREVLQWYFSKRIWADTCPEHCQPLGEMPDVTAYKELSKMSSRDGKQRHLSE